MWVGVFFLNTVYKSLLYMGNCKMDRNAAKPWRNVRGILQCMEGGQFVFYVVWRYCRWRWSIMPRRLKRYWRRMTDCIYALSRYMPSDQSAWMSGQLMTCIYVFIKRLRRLTDVCSSSWEPISELRNVTRHMQSPDTGEDRLVLD